MPYLGKHSTVPIFKKAGWALNRYESNSEKFPSFPEYNPGPPVAQPVA